MRSSLMILTLALTLLFALQQGAQAQYTWAPAYYGDPAVQQDGRIDGHSTGRRRQQQAHVFFVVVQHMTAEQSPKH